MKALWIVLALLPLLAGAAPRGSADAGPVQPPHVAGLGKLTAELRRHLLQHGSRAPMPWREAVVVPETENLLWGARTLRWNKGRTTFRAAYDADTRWYYVVRTDRRGAARYFGPIDQRADGSFADWRSGAR